VDMQLFTKALPVGGEVRNAYRLQSKGQRNCVQQIMKHTYKLAYPPSHLPMIPFLQHVSADPAGKAEAA
jgi:hypothetical protein